MSVAKRWDQWFESVNDPESTRAWKAAKEVHGSNPVMLKVWAEIIELNRLDALTKKKTTPESSGVV